MIGLLGGTFNPVHVGHLSLAKSVLNAFKLEQVEFIPSYQSVHRNQPDVAAELRRDMLALALQPHTQFCLNHLEIERRGPSYTVDTLQQIKQQKPGITLCWLLGVDAFNDFLSWKNPQGILRLAHLIVCTRPGHDPKKNIFPEHHLSLDEQLSDFTAGKIVFYEMPPNACSSTAIRAQLKRASHGLDTSVTECLPQSVLKFIQQHQLYE